MAGPTPRSARISASSSSSQVSASMAERPRNPAKVARALARRSRNDGRFGGRLDDGRGRRLLDLGLERGDAAVALARPDLGPGRGGARTAPVAAARARSPPAACG